MSGSESGVMAGSRESPMKFTMALHQQQQHSQAPTQQSQNMQLSFGGEDGNDALYKQPMRRSPSPPQQYQPGENPVLNMNMPGAETEGGPVKKRRGRPRKYGPESGEMSLGLVSGAPSFTVSQPTGGSSSGGGGGGEKRMRGRPPGSSNKPKLQALGSTGMGFAPHILTVRAGEDVASKIMALTQNGPRSVCVLSANGAISNMTLRQLATSGGTVTYEGRYEILCLSGSFHSMVSNGHRSRSGGLSVSLSGPDGNVLGGSVAGLLIAASPVQIVVGSFIPEGQKEPNPHVGQMDLSPPIIPRVAPTQVLRAPSSPQSRGTMSESSCGGGHASPLHQSTGGPYNSTNHNMPWK
ncbi:PREDICTED: AT-hook motif nuclear-localized protein 10-like [Camelina sativa]|uniref:AT-hook motif nuclear-localized protein n=1 Tax=Camelina sativa TaxID=90675 RepID=A0ABM0SNI5_CAMSA|nr:PREDICTED: AT-hook motif nuclear-localized protein 10-like [Camelina sativa]XP_010413833.1 PREDICTED: AT-hook motif nuclear-localized protein 10-like [Camelina sativa]